MENFNADDLAEDHEAYLDQINKFRQLRSNWNGNGALNFTPKVIDSALMQLSGVMLALKEFSVNPSTVEIMPGDCNDIEMDFCYGDKMLSITTTHKKVYVECHCIGNHPFAPDTLINAVSWLCNR